MNASSGHHESWMRRAVELARRGRGRVEPNPEVGCLIVKDGVCVAEGWHERFGGPHAEVRALERAGTEARGATCFVTLEPCCHHGKTPPCTEALIAAGVEHVVIGCLDPSPTVRGGGVRALESAGIRVTAGVLQDRCASLIAPFAKRMERGRPWIHAKWAMTADGRLATAARDAEWISCEASRRMVHELRGVCDAVVVGIETVLADDPRLTARPSGLRTATRIVLDSQARLPLTSRLVRTSRDVPVLVAVASSADPARVAALEEAGCEVWSSDAGEAESRLAELLDELDRREMTHVLVEGGGKVLGSFFALREVDELHVFVAPKLVGGVDAPVPIFGPGKHRMSDAVTLIDPHWHHVGGDMYLHGRIDWSSERTY